jgi:hypothetical protein
MPKHENQAAAEAFAAAATLAGFRAEARHTLAVGSLRVVNGWAVNIHDPMSEIGVVCAWYGRRHVQMYIEFHGTLADSAEMGQAFIAFLASQRREDNPEELT